jgi:hypothetical protein
MVACMSWVGALEARFKFIMEHAAQADLDL